MFIMPPYSISEADIAVRFGRPKDDYLIARKAGEVPFGIYAAQEYLDAIQEENYEWICVEVGGVQGQNSKAKTTVKL